jgi:hypothetical protein
MLLLSALIAAAPPKPADAVVQELGMPELAGLPDKLPKQYLPDAVMIGDVYQNPAKYPVRITVLRAADAVSESYKLKPVQEIFEKRLDGDKKAIADFQEKLAATILKLREASDDLEKAAEKRKMEPSARWQAHLDFLQAETKFRIGTLEELNLAYGTVHRNELPAIDAKANHTGWKISPADKMRSKSDIRQFVEEAQEGFEAVKKAHPETPWAKLAERELALKPGLGWVSADVKPPPVKVDPKKKRP